MKVAVAGKGGSGKTTISGTLVRSFAASGEEVLTIDDDDDPNLSIVVGVPRSKNSPVLPEDIVTRVKTSENEFQYHLNISPKDIINDYGITPIDGVTLLKAGTVKAGNGCFGKSHVTVRLILSNLREPRDDVIIVDLPNGIEHFGFGTAKDVDMMLMVVEPDYKSLDTVPKMIPLARELGIPEIRVVANKVRTEHDRGVVEDYCEDHSLDVTSFIPFDDAIRLAELNGSAPIDYNPDSPAVRAICELAENIQSINCHPRSKSGKDHLLSLKLKMGAETDKLTEFHKPRHFNP